jgi:amidohydrolase
MEREDHLLEDAAAIAGGVVADRRAIHRRPELAYGEHETAALVAARLRELGVPLRTGVGGTGVVGLIEGARPGRTVLLRADMDALPIEEESGAEYASTNPGVMHACGHDAHTAILLGATRLLLERRAELAGTVKLMFQPAEEGGAGALRMIEDGLLEDPPVDGAFMLHVSHQLYAGQVATGPGPMLAGANAFTITIEGRGGHASRPHMAVDPVVAAAQMVTALQTLVSREAPPGEPAVVTMGSLHAGTTHNVIPDRAVIEGTIRAYDGELMELLERRLEEIARGVARALRADAAVEFEMRYPPTVNDAAMAELLAGAARSTLGAEAVLEGRPIMAAEDFSFVLQRVPGAMLSLGVRSRDWAEPRPVHTARFDLDESALPVGVACMAAVALEFLGG